jgi:hypothetical protein
VAIKPALSDKGLICEVKWLKGVKTADVAKDIWKLVLSRSTVAEGQALRCYLLLGGESSAFSSTINALRNSHIDLRWRNATGGGLAPAPRYLNMRKFIHTHLGSSTLKAALTWAEHIRIPPSCWERLVLARRCEPWVRTLDGSGWRAVLFEVHHHGAPNAKHLDMAMFRGDIRFGCSAKAS